jgi:hypothetical protein
MASAMATTVASSAALQIGRSAAGGVGGSSSSSTKRGSGIDWNNFNYPPLLTLFHYDSSELPAPLASVVRLFHWSFILTCVACAVNLFFTLIVTASCHTPGRWLIQSLLHLVLIPTPALAVFYSGYVGLAEPNDDMEKRFKVMGQPALAFAYFMLGLVPWGSVNGLAKLGMLGDFPLCTGGSATFWSVGIVVESVLWLGNAALAVVNVVRCHSFDAYAGGQGFSNSRASS